MYKKISGVYTIQSKIKPERVYVGSGMSIKGRWEAHRRLLRKNKHHSPQLQRHYNKYGANDLVYEILEDGDYINKNHLLAREQGWFDHFSYNNNGFPYFNCDPLAGSRLGSKASMETRKLLSERGKGKKKKPRKPYKQNLTPEQRELKRQQNLGANNPMFGKKRSLESRLAQSERQKGRKHTEEAKRKIGLAHKGIKINRIISEEERKRRSEATSGKNNPMFGKHHSEETKMKLRKPHKKRMNVGN
jgi:group I intron endonuclease